MSVCVSVCLCLCVCTRAPLILNAFAITDISTDYAAIFHRYLLALKVKVDVAVLGSLSLIVLMVSENAKQHCTESQFGLAVRYLGC